MTTQSIDAKLAELGISLPTGSDPAANYANVVQVRELLFVSGKAPRGTDGVPPNGKLGGVYTTEQGYQFARQAAIEVLAVLKDTLGSLDRVKRFVKVQGFVNAEPHFDEHHKVLNGCSDLLVEVFGERGRHARSVLGANSLRGNLPIVIDTIVEIDVA